MVFFLNQRLFSPVLHVFILTIPLTHLRISPSPWERKLNQLKKYDSYQMGKFRTVFYILSLVSSHLNTFSTSDAPPPSWKELYAANFLPYIQMTSFLHTAYLCRFSAIHTGNSQEKERRILPYCNFNNQCLTRIKNI